MLHQNLLNRFKNVSFSSPAKPHYRFNFNLETRNKNAASRTVITTSLVVRKYKPTQLLLVFFQFAGID